MYKRILTIAIVTLLPSIAFAQESGLMGTLEKVDAVLKFFLGIAMPLAIAFFFWGLIQFIRNGENADLKGKGKNMMISSGVALFLMVGIWSILGYVQSSIGLTGEVDVSTPPPVQVYPDF